jgi:SAM-dependent methyltransferase
MADQRSLDQIREHYEIEKELASRLRSAPKSERRRLYTELYGELFRRVPHHPGLTRRLDPVAQSEAIAYQLGIVRRFLRPDSVFLELGPGDCSLSFAVAPLTRRVYGVDVSDGMLPAVQSPANFELILSDGAAIPLPEASVHVAFSNQLLEHLHPEDAVEQLRGVYRALLPGGVYVCVTPNRLAGPHDVSQHFDPVATGFHLKEYTTREMVPLFRSVGFRRFRRFLFKRGIWILLPLFPAPAIEAALERLRPELCRRIARSLPGRLLVGADIRLVATK